MPAAVAEPAGTPLQILASTCERQSAEECPMPITTMPPAGTEGPMNGASMHGRGLSVGMESAGPTVRDLRSAIGEVGEEQISQALDWRRQKGTNSISNAHVDPVDGSRRTGTPILYLTVVSPHVNMENLPGHLLKSSNLVLGHNGGGWLGKRDEMGARLIRIQTCYKNYYVVVYANYETSLHGGVYPTNENGEIVDSSGKAFLHNNIPDGVELLRLVLYNQKSVDNFSEDVQNHVDTLGNDAKAGFLEQLKTKLDQKTRARYEEEQACPSRQQFYRLQGHSHTRPQPTQLVVPREGPQLHYTKTDTQETLRVSVSGQKGRRKFVGRKSCKHPNGNGTSSYKTGKFRHQTVFDEELLKYAKPLLVPGPTMRGQPVQVTEVFMEQPPQHSPARQDARVPFATIVHIHHNAVGVTPMMIQAVIDTTCNRVRFRPNGTSDNQKSKSSGSGGIYLETGLTRRGQAVATKMHAGPSPTIGMGRSDAKKKTIPFRHVNSLDENVVQAVAAAAIPIGLLGGVLSWATPVAYDNLFEYMGRTPTLSWAQVLPDPQSQVGFRNLETETLPSDNPRAARRPGTSAIPTHHMAIRCSGVPHRKDLQMRKPAWATTAF
jgi:hypothetical protein